MNKWLIAVILIALLLAMLPIGAGAQSVSPVATPTAHPFDSPLETPMPTAIRLTQFAAK